MSARKWMSCEHFRGEAGTLHARKKMDALKAVFGALVGLLLLAIVGLLIGHIGAKYVGEKTPVDNPVAESDAPSSTTTPTDHKTTPPAPQPQPRLAPELSRDFYV